MHSPFDQNVPKPLKRILSEHYIEVPRQRVPHALDNGNLIAAAERAGFDLLVTADQNLRYQQNMTARRIALVVLGSNRWSQLQPHLVEDR